MGGSKVLCCLWSTDVESGRRVGQMVFVDQEKVFISEGEVTWCILELYES